MKMVKKKLSFKIFFVFLLTLMTFSFVSLNTFAKSNIDFTYENDIEDYKYSNLIISDLAMQFQNDNFIEFEFYDSNNVSHFVVEMNFPIQGAFNIVVDSEFTLDLSNQRFGLNFIEFLISRMKNYSTNYDYISIFEKGYFRIVNYDDEIYDYIVSSDYFTFDFVLFEYSLIDRLLNVFINVGSYLMVLINGLIVVFYVNNQLTVLGILALCGLAIAVILLIFKIIQNFLHFRG